LDREKSTHFALGFSAAQRTFAVKFRAETGSNPITHQPVRLAGACEHFGSSRARSLWSRNVPKSGEIYATFQRAFSKTTFASSNPLKPANHCRLCHESQFCDKIIYTSMAHAANEKSLWRKLAPILPFPAFLHRESLAANF
jgi:hypothetical protein